LASKHPFFPLPWHQPSDQPARISDRRLKRHLHRLSAAEYVRTAATAAVFAPLVAARYATIQPNARTRTLTPVDFIGLGVSLDSAPDAVLRDLIAESGVRHILLRVPVWDRDRFGRYQEFLSGLPACVCEVVIAILQDRRSVADHAQWRDDLRAIFSRFGERCTWYQIGQASNRQKWGCANFAEHAELIEIAERLRPEFPSVRLVGPAIIDFEPLAMMRSLINLRHFSFDAVSSLLYVDRRGAPANRQYGFFDLERKIRFQAALASLSPRVTEEGRQRLWITETNWPIAGTGESAPTSTKECVSEERYADFLRGYFQQAYATGLVERVYWWQLVAAGYGLVDPRGGLRRRAGFDVLRRLVSGDIALGG
jgi:hypothetical protein